MYTCIHVCMHVCMYASILYNLYCCGFGDDDGGGGGDVGFVGCMWSTLVGCCLYCTYLHVPRYSIYVSVSLVRSFALVALAAWWRCCCCCWCFVTVCTGRVWWWFVVFILYTFVFVCMYSVLFIHKYIHVLRSWMDGWMGRY